jgi:hypothetical protein
LSFSLLFQSKKSSTQTRSSFFDCVLLWLGSSIARSYTWTVHSIFKIHFKFIENEISFIFFKGRLFWLEFKDSTRTSWEKRKQSTRANQSRRKNLLHQSLVLEVVL